MFSGLLFCPDCGNKLHFATCKNFDGKQDHYVCSSYKSGRGTCSAHYIREDVLRELVLERIQAVNEYIRGDVEGFQEEWLHYRRADQERDIREDQKRVEQAKKRLATLDVVMSRLYEDYALGEISKEKYKKMTADYEAKQERLKLEIETTEEWVEQRQAMGDDLDAFIALTKKYVDVADNCQRVYQEDRHSCAGQVWRQAPTEGGDFLQLRGRCGDPRAGRTHDRRIYPWTQKNGVTFSVTPFSAPTARLIVPYDC